MESENNVNRVSLRFFFILLDTVNFNQYLKYKKKHNLRISTGYGENTRPIIGFSLLQPQNDPKKCVYLLVSHSSVVNLMRKPQNARPKSSSDISMNKSIRKSLLENELNKIGNINETRIRFVCLCVCHIGFPS